VCSYKFPLSQVCCWLVLSSRTHARILPFTVFCAAHTLWFVLHVHTPLPVRAFALRTTLPAAVLGKTAPAPHHAAWVAGTADAHSACLQNRGRHLSPHARARSTARSPITRVAALWAAPSRATRAYTPTRKARCSTTTPLRAAARTPSLRYYPLHYYLPAHLACCLFTPPPATCAHKFWLGSVASGRFTLPVARTLLMDSMPSAGTTRRPVPRLPATHYTRDVATTLPILPVRLYARSYPGSVVLVGPLLQR